MSPSVGTARRSCCQGCSSFPTGVQSKTVFGKMDFQVYGREPDLPAKLIKHSFWQSCSAVKMAIRFAVRADRRALFGGQRVGTRRHYRERSRRRRKARALDVLHLVIVISINLGIMNLLAASRTRRRAHSALRCRADPRQKGQSRRLRASSTFVGSDCSCSR